MKFRFKNFKVYQDSKRFCKSCRDIVKKNIKSKDKDLASQIERALNSIYCGRVSG
jgi:hypothetical protein